MWSNSLSKSANHIRFGIGRCTSVWYLEVNDCPVDLCAFPLVINLEENVWNMDVFHMCGQRCCNCIYFAEVGATFCQFHFYAKLPEPSGNFWNFFTFILVVTLEICEPGIWTCRRWVLSVRKVRVQCFGWTAKWWLFTERVSYGGSLAVFRAVGCVVVSHKSV